MNEVRYYMSGEFFLFDVVPLFKGHSSASANDDHSALGKYIGCPLCKAGSKTINALFGNTVFIWTLTQATTAICDITLPFGGRYSGSICEGVLRNQFQQYLLPVALHDMTQHLNLCTYILDVCPVQGIKAIDVNQEVEEILSSKPAAIQDNDFV